jgi:phage gp46-like protein
MSVTFRVDEGCRPQTPLPWDTIWSARTGQGDWALAGPDETLNRGGLRAKAAIATAVELALFTDRRCPPDHPLARLVDGDSRGWWGNGVDLREDQGEAELGSLLWLLEQAPLTEDSARWAKAMAEEALAPLIAQGAAARIEVTAQARREQSRLDIAIAVYARDGARIYDRKFDLLWQQVR